MKIKPDHLESLRKAVTRADTPQRRDNYRAGNFTNAAKTKNVDMRYRWDTLYASVPDALMREMYVYMNDNNIDSALRSIIKPLNEDITA